MNSVVKKQARSTEKQPKTAQQVIAVSRNSDGSVSLTKLSIGPYKLHATVMKSRLVSKQLKSINMRRKKEQRDVLAQRETADALTKSFELAVNRSLNR